MELNGENYWKECKRITGPANAKTEQEIGVPGAWTLKVRGPAKIWVGCVTLKGSDFEELKIMDETKKRLAVHLSVCEHGNTIGASTRKIAIKLSKKSASWCKECAKLSAAL